MKELILIFAGVIIGVITMVYMIFPLDGFVFAPKLEWSKDYHSEEYLERFCLKHWVKTDENSARGKNIICLPFKPYK